MGAGHFEVDKCFSAWLKLTDATAKTFPELMSIFERAVLLEAIALADSEGYVCVETWQERTGIRATTMERYVRYFAGIGLMYTDELCVTVRVEDSARARLLAEFPSAGKS